MTTKLLKSVLIGAAVLMGSIGGVAMAEEATAPKGGELQVSAYQSGNYSNWAETANTSSMPMVPFLKLGSSEASGVWVDLGAPRKLTGAMYQGRNGFPDRWKQFRVWGTDTKGPYTSTAGMELVISNYLGAAYVTGSLTNYEGIAAHRYYYFDNYGALDGNGLNRNSEFNFQIQLYADVSVATMYVPVETDANEGNFTFTGKVTYASSEAGAEVCVAVAREDFDADYSKWAMNGKIYKAAGTYQTGDAFGIEANGLASGRTYTKLFCRSVGETDWLAAPGGYQFASRGTLATPRVYVWDKTNPTNSNDSSQALYDGNYGYFGDGDGRAQQLIFKLDPSLDYAVLRVWPRLGDSYLCWVRAHLIKGLYVAKPSEEPDWSAAEKVEKITKREFYWVKNEADIPTMEWTLLPAATETMKHEQLNPGINERGKYNKNVDVVLDKKLMNGAKYFKIELASNLMLNGVEVELYTVKKQSFCIRVQ